MSYITDTSGMPRLYSYKDAAEAEASIKPIRGRKDMCKPLSKNRRKQYVNIRREGEAVVVRMYSTDILTFYPDGRLIVQFGGWNTMSTREVIGHVTGGIWFHTNRNNLFCNAPKYGVDAREERDSRKLFKVDDSAPIEFRNTQYSYPFNWALVDPKPYVIHKVNRKNKTAIMREFKPFVDYLDRMIRLRDGSLKLSDDERAATYKLPLFKTFMDALRGNNADHEVMYNAMMALWYQCRTFAMSFESLKRALDKQVIEKYKDEVLDAIEVENGGGEWDRYSYLF